MMPPEVRADALIMRVRDAFCTQIGAGIRGAEIGVFKGQMSALLLHRLPALTLYMVDSWAPTEAQPEAYRACGDYHAMLPAEKQERCYRQTLEAVRFALDRAVILRMDSIEAARRIDDHSLAFAFIDGDHSYEGCAADLVAWAPKVKPGGILCGHDYDHPIKTGFGVKLAVDEMVEACEWPLELGPDMTWFVRMP